MKKIITIVLDGFGYREEEYGNAIKKANMSNYNYLWNNYPHSILKASEEAVGLPEGQMGGSEVGHLTIGSGRVIKQELNRITEIFEKKELEENESFKELIKTTVDNDSRLHIVGLVSNGGVHSHINHLKNLIRLIKKTEIKKCFIHVISDGRDVGTQTVSKFINEVKKTIGDNEKFSIASVCGRFYAMDRDNKWERTKIYHDLLTKGVGYNALDCLRTIETCYKKGVTDEYLPPIMMDPDGIIRDRDTLFWFNFRTDRAKQILSSLTNPNFSEFSAKKLPNLKVWTFLEVDKTVISNCLLERIVVENTLGRYLGELGLTQARIAETEKFAHVTYFFDGMDKSSVEGCDRFLVPSPQVSVYDKAPRMSAEEVCKKAIGAMNKDYDFILVNFANPDMVGHTGNMDATIQALEAVDDCLGHIIEAAEMNFYTIFLLADHGNADIMLNEKGEKCTTHTLSPVPFIVTDKNVTLENGDLSNVAPAILEYMDIKIPEEMSESKIILKKG